MSREEQAIWNFLNDYPQTAFPRREIARRAVKRKVYEEDPNWVNEPLNALVARGVAEVTEDGHYQLSRRSI